MSRLALARQAQQQALDEAKEARRVFEQLRSELAEKEEKGLIPVEALPAAQARLNRLYSDVQHVKDRNARAERAIRDTLLEARNLRAVIESERRALQKAEEAAAAAQHLLEYQRTMSLPKIAQLEADLKVLVGDEEITDDHDLPAEIGRSIELAARAGN